MSSDGSDRMDKARAAWGLTRRQAQVLEQVVLGASNKDIAGHLACSVKNVETHVSGLLRKAGCANRAGLVSRYFRG